MGRFPAVLLVHPQVVQLELLAVVWQGMLQETLFAQKTNVIHRQAHSVMSTILATNTKGWIPITIYGK
ncbi:hypothetical protein HMPREF2744_29945 [Pseudomonas aeruginosa]|nr:hypothetical protein BHE76_26735 [Pseudomonas aeruginosa]KXD20219.1 hypothetical protein AW902_12045 [Pseudomonas aeruginosa]OHP27266.1 hypothetical protein HMPREF2535_05080 [Pseudomonas sp. HMSC060F12]OHP34001.1 hypothetical protein HMPREF2744_29945 [Pseudomonas aeruginosa]